MFVFVRGNVKNFEKKRRSECTALIKQVHARLEE